MSAGLHLIKHAAWRALERGGQFVLLGSAPDPKIQACALLCLRLGHENGTLLQLAVLHAASSHAYLLQKRKQCSPVQSHTEFGGRSDCLGLSSHLSYKRQLCMEVPA